MRTELTPAAIDFLQDLAALLEKHDAGLWAEYASDAGIYVGDAEISTSSLASAEAVWGLLSEAYAPQEPPKPRTPMRIAADKALTRWMLDHSEEQAKRQSYFARILGS